MARFGRFGQLAAEWLMVGGREDILPLTCVGDCIDVTRARALLDAGMKSPKDIVGFGVKRVQKAIKRLNTVKNSAYTATRFLECVRNLSPKKRKRQEEAEQRMRELMEEEELFSWKRRITRPMTRRTLCFLKKRKTCGREVAEEALKAKRPRFRR